MALCVIESETERMRFLTEGSGKKKGGRGGRKPDPTPNSIEGERSQFGLAAEGRLQQFVKLRRPPVHAFYGKRAAGHQEIKTSISTPGRGGCKVALSSGLEGNLITPHLQTRWNSSIFRFLKFYLYFFFFKEVNR